MKTNYLLAFMIAISPGLRSDLHADDRLLHRPIGQVLVELYDAEGNFVDSVRSQSDGHYVFHKGMDKGEYQLKASSPQKMLVRDGMGITRADADLLSDASFVANIQPNTILFLAADVNEDGKIMTLDRSLINSFYINKTLTNFSNITTPRWRYIIDNFPIGLQSDEMRIRHLRGVMKGDVNLSYTGEGLTDELMRLHDRREVTECLKEESNSTVLFPNPAHEKVVLETYLSEDDYLRLKIVDMMGRTLLQKELGKQHAGQQSFEVSLHEVPPGVYLMVLDGNATSRIVQRFIVK